MFDFLLERQVLNKLKATYHGDLLQITVWTGSEFDKVERALKSLEKQGKVTQVNGRWTAV